MGLFDKLKEKSRGVMTDAQPEDGVAPAPAGEVRRRLLAISGRGIETAEEDEIVIAWSAQIAAAGPGGAGSEYLYRAIRISLDEADHTATGICLKTTSETEVGPGGFAGLKSWEKGQHVGSESVHVLAWLGPHRTEGGADESGYKFSWSDLRDPVLEAVTGAAWTYHPKKF